MRRGICKFGPSDSGNLPTRKRKRRIALVRRLRFRLVWCQTDRPRPSLTLPACPVSAFDQGLNLSIRQLLFKQACEAMRHHAGVAAAKAEFVPLDRGQVRIDFQEFRRRGLTPAWHKSDQAFINSPLGLPS